LENISLAHKRQEHFYSTWIFHLTKTIQFKFKILWNNTLEVAFDWRDISTQGESPDENIVFEFDRGSGVVTGGGLAAAPMEQDMDRGYIITMGARGPESRPAPQERRSVLIYRRTRKRDSMPSSPAGIYPASTM